MIRLQNLSFRYPRSESPVLQRVSLEITAGEFALVCGPTGSGKSTLIKTFNGLAPHFTGGELSGQVFIAGEDVTGRQPHQLAEVLGYVNQQPEGSFVAEIVRDELAYGMEQLGFEVTEMSKRVESIAERLDIADLLDNKMADLSGGQQQRVAIGAALAAGQKILVLDEPTSALDPEAALGVVMLLRKLADESGVTVVLIEHRLERVIDQADSLVVVNGDGSVSKGSVSSQINNYRLVPPMVELSQKLKWPEVPVNLTDARRLWLANRAQIAVTGRFASGEMNPASSTPLLKATDIAVTFGQKVAVAGVTIELNPGRVTAVMGSNGSGKSSLLWAIHGSGARDSGQVETSQGDPKDIKPAARLGLVTLVPQKASDLIFLSTLGAELEESDRISGRPSATTAAIFASLANRVDPNLHPRDLSAGQQLSLVLAMQLAKDAPIVLLDEPTRGLDYESKRQLAGQLKILTDEGRALLVASHDVEFVAMVADEVLILKNGKIQQQGLATELLGHRGPLPSQVAQISLEDSVIAVAQCESLVGALNQPKSLDSGSQS